MEACYEYLGCDKKDCVMYGRTDTIRCWGMPDTLCNHLGIEIMQSRVDGDKEEACSRCGCIYYKAVSDMLLVRNPI